MTQERTNRAFSPFLLVMFAMTVLMGVIQVAFHVQILPEIIGFTGLVLVFWLITEAMGWKSTSTPDHTASSTQFASGDSAGPLFVDLPGTCEVFHDINTGHAKIDHLILSKEHGLFIVEIKDHPGKVTSANAHLLINNIQPDQDFFVRIIWNSFWLMERARKATKLPITVTPIVVFSNATVDVGEPINGVTVISRNDLAENIRKTKTDPEICASLWKIHEGGVQPW